MGGQATPSAPNLSPQYAAAMNTAAFNAQNLANRAELLKLQQAPTQFTPDIAKMQDVTKDYSLVNAYNSDLLEKTLDPQTFAIRNAYKKAIADVASPESDKAWINNWLKTSGLQKMFGTGAQGTIAASGLTDAATREGLARKLQGIQVAQGLATSPKPVAGLNPATLATMGEQARYQNMVNQYGFGQSMLGAQLGMNQAMGDIGNQSFANIQSIAAQDAQNRARAAASVSNPWANLFGGALSGGGSMAATGNPYAIAGGALLGGIGGGASSQW